MEYPQLNVRIGKDDRKILDAITRKTSMSEGEVVRLGISLVAAKEGVKSDVCQKCGAKYALRAIYCHHCGTRR